MQPNGAWFIRIDVNIKTIDLLLYVNLCMGMRIGRTQAKGTRSGMEFHEHRANAQLRLTLELNRSSLQKPETRNKKTKQIQNRY